MISVSYKINNYCGSMLVLLKRVFCDYIYVYICKHTVLHKDD